MSVVGFHRSSILPCITSAVCKLIEYIILHDLLLMIGTGVSRRPDQPVCPFVAFKWWQTRTVTIYASRCPYVFHLFSVSSDHSDSTQDFLFLLHRSFSPYKPRLVAWMVVYTLCRIMRPIVEVCVGKSGISVNGSKWLSITILRDFRGIRDTQTGSWWTWIFRNLWIRGLILEKGEG